MKLWVFLSSLLLVYFIYGFYLSQTDTYTGPARLKPATSAVEFYDYKGVINAHTNLTIGSSSPAQVIAAAKASGLDFLMLTDLNLFTLPNNLDGYHGRTLVMVGRKISYLDSRIIHYSLKPQSLGNNLGEVQVKIADLLTQPAKNRTDDLLILAHPYKSGFTWSGEIPQGFDGFELLNAKSLSNRTWESSKFLTLWSLITYPFNPNFSFLRLFSEPTDELELLSKLEEQRKILIYAGAEASARAIPLANYLIKFPSYQRSFEFLTNHVLLKSELTGQPQSDRQKIFNALKQGTFYLCIELLGDPKGFNAWIDSGARDYPMGSVIPSNKDMRLKFHLPFEPINPYSIWFFKDGEFVSSLAQTDGSFPLKGKGVYRIEVRVRPRFPMPDSEKWVTWIYTNPFFVN